MQGLLVIEVLGQSGNSQSFEIGESRFEMGTLQLGRLHNRTKALFLKYSGRGNGCIRKSPEILREG